LDSLTLRPHPFTLASLFGTWLSLVEYLNGVQVVVGSNPAVPTIL
jgi:hypothetical protein